MFCMTQLLLPDLSEQWPCLLIFSKPGSGPSLQPGGVGEDLGRPLGAVSVLL